MRWATFFHVLIGAMGLAGCRPNIGDSCVSSVDCSSQGDRLCDTSQPDGYCTIFGCEPDACPGDPATSVCVGFGLDTDPLCSVSGTDPRWPRFEKTFCMHACEADTDCREGYVCVKPSERRAMSIDIDSEIRDSAVCFIASEASFEGSEEPCVQPAELSAEEASEEEGRESSAEGL